MSNIINSIRFAIRSMLCEEIQEQAIIVLEAMPGDPPRGESYIRVYGFDKAMSRGSSGFGGGVPTAGASHGSAPTLEPTEEDVGAWKVIGLPDRTPTGMNSPTPWIVFMDWFWKFLKDVGMSPMPYKGFGDVDKPYGKLTPAQKRHRKYGVQHLPGESPEERETGEAVPGRTEWAKTKALHGHAYKWPVGFDVKRDVMIVVDPLGEEQDAVKGRFRDLMSKAAPDNWFRIAEYKESGVFLVFVNIDAEMPEGWRERLAAMEISRKSKRKAEWHNLLVDLSENRSNVAQLTSLIGMYLAEKYKFEYPFHIDTLDDSEYERAKQAIQNTKLDDIVAYAQEKGMAPPIVGQMPSGRASTMKDVQFEKIWDNIIERLAEQGGADPLTTDVALSNYMAQHGFSDPFEFEMLSSQLKLKAINMASRIKFDNLNLEMESARQQIKSLLG